jgi:hypothetical protein
VYDLEEYVRLRAKKDTDITIQLRDLIAQMDDDELELAQKYYVKLLGADIRTLGNIGCIELAIKTARWVYPRMLKEAYSERSKSWML